MTKPIVPLLIASLLLLTGCTNFYSVEIRVSGNSKKAVVAYAIDSNRSQALESLPFKHNDVATDASVISASAQKLSKGGTATVEIAIDGQVVQSEFAGPTKDVAAATVRLPPEDRKMKMIQILVVVLLGAVVVGISTRRPPKTEQS